MISVIIPFYNEKENLPVLISGLILELEKIDKQWEIVLVDDGSTDNFQFSHLRQGFGGQANIKLIKHKKRLGKGQALKTGIENAKGEIIVFMDGDLQDDPKDLSKLLKKIEEGNDFVNGIRINRQENGLVKRLLHGFCTNFLIHLLPILTADIKYLRKKY